MDRQEYQIDQLRIQIVDEGYVHFHFSKSEDAVPEKVIKEALSYLKKNLFEKVYLLITTESGATLSQEAREYASSEAYDEFIIGDAIVRTDYSHEMAANFFIRFNKPNRTVKLFPSKDKAVKWILELKNERNSK